MAKSLVAISLLLASICLAAADEIYNVKNFGALGDGRHDDTRAIRRAYNEIPKSGGTLYFPPGVYRLAESAAKRQESVDFNSEYYFLKIRKNLIIRGAGRKLTRIVTSKESVIFDTQGATNRELTVAGLTLEYDGGYSERTVGYGIYVQTRRLIVQDCAFRNFLQAIHLPMRGECDYALIKRNEFTAKYGFASISCPGGWMGLHPAQNIINAARTTIVADNYFNGMVEKKRLLTTGKDGKPIPDEAKQPTHGFLELQHYWERLIVKNNRIYNNSIEAIQISRMAELTVDRPGSLLVENNTISTDPAMIKTPWSVTGISINVGYGQIARGTISDNKIKGTNNGILLTGVKDLNDELKRGTVEDITVAQNSIKEVLFGISLAGSRGIAIRGNSITVRPRFFPLDKRFMNSSRAAGNSAIRLVDSPGTLLRDNRLQSNRINWWTAKTSLATDIPAGATVYPLETSTGFSAPGWMVIDPEGPEPAILPIGRIAKNGVNSNPSSVAFEKGTIVAFSRGTVPEQACVTIYRSPGTKSQRNVYSNALRPVAVLEGGAAAKPQSKNDVIRRDVGHRDSLETTDSEGAEPWISP